MLAKQVLQEIRGIIFEEVGQSSGKQNRMTII